MSVYASVSGSASESIRRLVFGHGAEGALLPDESLMLLMPTLPMLLIGMVMLSVALQRRGYLPAESETVRLTTPLDTIAAGLSIGAASIHFAVLFEHLEEDFLYGVAFFAMAWFQALWPLAYLVARRRWLAWVGVAGNAAITAVWVISRTVGLPFGPDAMEPQMIGTLDLFATVFQVGLVLVLLPTVAPRVVPALANRTLAAQKGFVLASFGVLTVALLAGVALLEIPGAE